MPEKFIHWWEHVVTAIGFALVGIMIGLGQLLLSKEVLTCRIIVGRALSTGGIAMAAGAALAWYPDLPLVAQIGLAAGLASLGTSGLERMFQRALQGRAG